MATLRAAVDKVVVARAAKLLVPVVLVSVVLVTGCGGSSGGGSSSTGASTEFPARARVRRPVPARAARRPARRTSA